jgi:hypothetical protein
MMLCDLCGQGRECLQKTIEGKEYDICADCWSPLAEKLKGKGRVKRRVRETVFVPPLTKEPETPPMHPPKEPPKIWGESGRTQ